MCQLTACMMSAHMILNGALGQAHAVLSLLACHTDTFAVSAAHCTRLMLPSLSLYGCMATACAVLTR